MENPEILNNYRSFLQHTDSSNEIEVIGKVWEIFQELDDSVLTSAGINIDPAHFEQTISAMYKGQSLALAIKEVARKLRYVASLYIYNEPETYLGSMEQNLTDIRRILIGKLHLVECVVDDPNEAKKIQDTIEIYQKVAAHNAVKTAFSTKLIDEKEQKPPEKTN